MYSATANYGFTTGVRLRFHSIPEAALAERVGASVQALLNLRASKIDGLAGVITWHTLWVKIDGVFCFLPLELHTDRDLPFHHKLRLAQDVVNFARANVILPEIAEVVDDGAPPVATCGF